MNSSLPPTSRKKNGGKWRKNQEFFFFLTTGKASLVARYLNLTSNNKRHSLTKTRHFGLNFVGK